MNLESDKRCWEEVAMKAHLKIINLEKQIKNENKKHRDEMQTLMDKHHAEINNLREQNESLKIRADFCTYALKMI